MRDAVIVEAVRTPVGRRNGGLSGVHPAALSAHVLNALVERAGVEPGAVDDVIWGCVGQVGEQTFDIARTAVLSAGWPESIPGVTIDRQCGSSQQSVHFAAAGLIAGQYDVVVAGGVESMSRVPLGSSVGEAGPFPPAFLERYDGVVPHQGVGAEMMAERWGFSRSQLDEYSAASHEKAAAARAEGRFAGESAPVTLPDGAVVEHDEGIRPGTTVDVLAGLRTVFRPDGVITAGNSSQISDGSAALLMTTSDKARELGLSPIARVHTAVLAGDDPVTMLTAPIPATRRILERSGLSIADIDLVEINEAFASVVLAWHKELGADPERVNVNGGAIALGHPLGASGARLMATLLCELERTGGRFGLQTMCEGYGLANATIIERL